MDIVDRLIVFMKDKIKETFAKSDSTDCVGLGWVHPQLREEVFSTFVLLLSFFRRIQFVSFAFWFVCLQSAGSV